jgi:hypothetical protein
MLSSVQKFLKKQSPINKTRSYKNNNQPTFFSKLKNKLFALRYNNATPDVLASLYKKDADKLFDKYIEDADNDVTSNYRKKQLQKLKDRYPTNPINNHFKYYENPELCDSTNTNGEYKKDACAQIKRRCNGPDIVNRQLSHTCVKLNDFCYRNPTHAICESVDPYGCESYGTYTDENGNKFPAINHNINKRICAEYDNNNNVDNKVGGKHKHKTRKSRRKKHRKSRR